MIYILNSYSKFAIPDADVAAAGGGIAICTILNLKGDPDILNQGYFRSIEKWCYLIYLSKTISKSIYLRICSTFVVIFFCIFRMSPMRMREYSPWIK